MRHFVRTLSLVILSIALSGCGSFGKKLKSFISGKSGKSRAAVARTSPTAGRGPVHFSQRQDLRFDSKRKYRRMTKGRFENLGKVNSDAGSLWVMDGQGAYLFSQNRVRKTGDLLNVRLTGAAKEQLEAKVKVIKRLTRKLELDRKSRRFLAAQKNKKNRKKNAEKKDSTKTASRTNSSSRTPASQRDGALKVKTILTRIVEKLPDGNYRVKGNQTFMIGKKEYKVIVAGVIRAEDFNEDGIDSVKILDAKYDIVSSRRSFSR